MKYDSVQQLILRALPHTALFEAVPSSGAVSIGVPIRMAHLFANAISANGQAVPQLGVLVDDLQTSLVVAQSDFHTILDVVVFQA
jgi:hypothetical protein